MDLTVSILFLIGLILSSSSTFSQDSGVPGCFESYAKSYSGHVLYKGSDDHRSIALTFDDGPTAITAAILDLLDQYDVKATFFWQGKNLMKHPEMVRRAIASGHDLGNHSWDHPNCGEMDSEAFWRLQFDPTDSVYKTCFDLDVQLYRPPFGAVSEGQLDYLSELGIVTVLWSLSTLDWDIERNSGVEIFNRFKKDIHPGAIVLLHDMDFDNSATEKLDGLDNIIRHAKSAGYSFATITEIMKNNK